MRSRLRDRNLNHTKPSLFKRFFARLKSSIVTDIPADLYACEDCGKPKCSQEKWQNCENRIKHMHAVEQDREKNT